MFDVFELPLSIIVFSIYASICIVCLIFTFSREKYLEIEAKINLELLSNPILNPVLENNINWFHDWLMMHNKTVGPILVIFSVLDLKLSFLLIDIL